MGLKEKANTLRWFVHRPTHWRFALSLAARQVKGCRNLLATRDAATDWARRRARSAKEVVEILMGTTAAFSIPELPATEIEEAERRVRATDARMGGAGDLFLIHALARLARPERAVETGVAFGWSTLAILAAMEANDLGRLVSVDMPYVNEGKESIVGVAVPERLHHRWTLIREPDRNGLKKAVRQFSGQIDFAHYDSDKSHDGRSFAYPLLWTALRKGGILISDDIQDNFAFREFVEDLGVPYGITECSGKFVGALRKPLD